MRGACRKRVRYWFLDYGEIAFVLSILIMAAILIVWMLVLLLTPKTAVAGDITNFRTATRQALVTSHSDLPVTRESEAVVTMYMEISAYSPTVQECDASPLVTASGKRVYVGGVAADLGVFPFGTILLIDGYNNGKPCMVVDTGSLIRGKTLDVFFWHEVEAVQWGRQRSVKVQVLYVPKAQK